MTALRFMDATLQDVTEITECVAQAYAKARETISDLPDVTEGIDRDISENHVLLARIHGVMAGVVIYVRQGESIKVINLAVSPVAQGQGIAAQLLHRVEEDARAAKCSHLVLRTHRQMHDTRAIYAHLGWVETEISGNSVALSKDLK